METIYRYYADTEVVTLGTHVKCPYCGTEWLEEDVNEPGTTYVLECDDYYDNGCGKKFKMYFDVD